MKRLIMAAGLMLLAGAAYAQDDDSNITRSTLNAGVAAVFSDYSGDSSFPVEDSSLGLNFYALARPNSWFGIEAGYYNSGTFSTDIDPSGVGPVDISLSGFNVAALAFMPIFPESEYGLEIYVKLGLYDYDIDQTVQDGNSQIQSSLGHTTGAFGGGGVLLYISETIAIRTEATVYDIDNADLWSLNLGMQIGF